MNEIGNKDNRADQGCQQMIQKSVNTFSDVWTDVM